jgi:protein AFG1
MSFEALGPADYISLASTYRTFFVDDIPVILLKNKNEARRLINLVDALCEIASGSGEMKLIRHCR